MNSTVMILAASLLAAAATAPAQTAPPSPTLQTARASMHQVCAADQKSLCDGKQGKAMFQCLRQNNDKLSAGCKSALAKMPRPGQAPSAK